MGKIMNSCGFSEIWIALVIIFGLSVLFFFNTIHDELNGLDSGVLQTANKLGYDVQIIKTTGNSLTHKYILYSRDDTSEIEMELKCIEIENFQKIIFVPGKVDIE